MDTSKITRLEIIWDGREFVKHDVEIEMKIQDNERTMKIFIRNKPKKDYKKHIWKSVLDKENGKDVWEIIAVDSKGRMIVNYDNLVGEVFAYDDFELIGLI